MLNINPPPSTKRIGIHEHYLIEKLIDYYQDRDFFVFPHSSLNISWGTVYIDLDLILIKNDFVSYVEVKSKKDHFSKAYAQIDNVRDFIDYAYIAAEKDLSTEISNDVGLVSIHENDVSLVKPPKRINDKPSFHSILALKKKCLEKFFDDLENTRLITKYKLACRIYSNPNLCDKRMLQKAALCSRLCDSQCPLQNSQKISYY